MVSDRPERVARGAVLHTDSGDLVVAEARAHQGRWLVRFEGCARREDVEHLRDRLLWAEPIDDDDELWVHELIGCRVLDQDGIDRGVVEAVQENPAADLLVLQGGTLVPVVFARGAPRDGILRVEVPEGLFDL
jgi:16S rRNA processing protein RimM